MKFVLMYQNGQEKLFAEATGADDCIAKCESYYKSSGKEFKEMSEAFAVRIYLCEVEEKENAISCRIIKVKSDGKLQDKDKGVVWVLTADYKGKSITIELTDNKDVLYAIWDMLERVLKQKNTETIKDLKFDLHVRIKSSVDGYNQKQKLILFFSKPGNWGKFWKYSDVREAMEKDGLAMIGRGIEGERPREFRYDLGYPFLTSEQDKKVPDGSCIVEYPFPTMPRNERRNPNVSLEKKDWSEVAEILKSNPKKLRCFECGLFEGETNRIGQKTVFQKSHLECHLTGGDVSASNITSICRYCNSEQKNIYSYNKLTGKKEYNTVPFLKTRDYPTKIEALKFLLSHLKTEDVEKEVESAKASK